MSLIQEIEAQHKKPHVVTVNSGDTVRVSQKIKEGNKERIQVFEGLVIRTDRKNSHTATITVRRISSGIGVEKSFMLHSPLVTKVQVVKRSKVRRNYLSYMRQRTGKSARLTGVDFDQDKVNYVPEPKADESAEKVDDKPAKKPQVETPKEEKPQASNQQGIKKESEAKSDSSET